MATANMEGPLFYVGHHETQHRGLVTESTLRSARDCTVALSAVLAVQGHR